MFNLIEYDIDQTVYIANVLLGKSHVSSKHDMLMLIAASREKAVCSTLTDLVRDKLRSKNMQKRILKDTSKNYFETYGLVLFTDQYFSIMKALVGFSELDSVSFFMDKRRYDKRTNTNKNFMNKIDGTLVNREELERFLVYVLPVNRQEVEDFYTKYFNINTQRFESNIQ